MDLRTEILKIVKEELAKVQSFAAIVKDVDENTQTCTVYKDGEEDAPYYDVNLQAIGNAATGAFIYPLVNSDVYCQVLEGNKDNIFITKTSEIEKIHLISDKNGGLVISAETTKKLNALEKDLNSLKTGFKTWIPPTAAPDSGAALKAALTGYMAQNISLTKASELESKTVSHG
jgi:hypothetical protein